MALRERTEVPPETRTRLAAKASGIAHNNLTAISVIARISHALQAENLPFLVLKGLPLAQLAYDNLTVRHSKDIDLLIAPADLAAAERLLLELGFHRTGLTSSQTPTQTLLYRRFRQHYEFVQTTTGLRVELHWRAFENRLLSESLVAAPRLAMLGGGLQLPCLPQDELLLNLCIHGAGHAWFRLKWIADVAAILAQAPPDAASELLKLARQRDLDRPVEQALLLCEGLFTTSLFSDVSQHTRTGIWLAQLAANALLQENVDSLAPATEYVAPKLKRSRFLLRRSWRYRMEEIQLRTTSPIDWQIYALPPRLQFLYPLLRLPLWICRRWSSQAKTRSSF